VLLEEWAAQALLERHLGLPVSVVADANEKVQADGQINFISMFVLPLFERVSEAVPSMSLVWASAPADNALPISSYERICPPLRGK
jgi:3'5'-cyclic nucleotide phosphodiesterase